jgi:hypothetical protein
MVTLTGTADGSLTLPPGSAIPFTARSFSVTASFDW